MNKEIYNGLNLNGNAISGIGADDALATGGSLKYENGTLYYHNGTEWVALGEGMKYMGEIADATLPQGAEDGEVCRVMCDTHDQIYSSAAFTSGTWRTFTKQEMIYIIANYRHTFGKIGDVNGMFIIPNGVETSLTINSMTYSTNTITVAQWESMAAQGIVFLPRTDIWTNATSPSAPSTAKTAYWSGSIHGDPRSGSALCWIDNSSDTVSQIISNDDWWSTWSLAVRLVREVDASDTTSFATSGDADATHIKFADANLIYKRGYGFMFAKSAYDVYNKYGSPTETGWFDSFMYGTSGYAYQPWDKSGSSSTITTNISGTNNDWGTYNQIGGWTEGVYPAGSVFVVDNGELVPLCAGIPLDIYTQLPNIAGKISDVKLGTDTSTASSVVDATTHEATLLTQSPYSPATNKLATMADISSAVTIDNATIVHQASRGTITYTNDTWSFSETPAPTSVSAGNYFTVGTAFTLTDDTLLFTGIIPAGSYTTSQHFVYDGSQWRIESVNVSNGILTTAPDKFTIKYNMMESIIDPYTPQPLGFDLSVIKSAYDAGKKLSLILYATGIYSTAEDEYYEIKGFDWHYLEAEQGETIPINIKTGESQYTETNTDKCVMFTKTLSILGIAPEATTVLIYNDLTTNTTKIQIQSEGIYSPQAFQISAIEIPQREFGAAYLDVKRDEATISTLDAALRTISHNGTNWVYTNPSTTPAQWNIVQGVYFVVAENGFTLNTDTPLFGSDVPAGTYIQNAKLFFNGSGWEIYGSSDISLRNGALYAKRMTGASPNIAGTSGIVPQPMAGDNAKFLKGDGSWSAVPSTTYNETYTKTELLALDNTANALALYNRYVSALNEGKQCTLTVTGMNSATTTSSAIFTNQYILDASSHDSTSDYDNIYFKTFDRGPSSNAPNEDTITIVVYPSSAPTTARIYFRTTGGVVNQSYTTAQQTSPLKVVLTAVTTNTNGAVQYSPNITVTPSTNTLSAPKIVVSDGVYDSNNNLLTYSLSAGNGITFTDSGNTRTITAKTDNSSLKFNGSTMYVNIDDSTIKKTVSNGKLYVPIDDTTIKINRSGWMCSDRRIYLDWYYSGSSGPVGAGATLERLVATIDEATRIYDRASGHTQTNIDKLMTTVYNYMLKEAYVIRYKIFQGLPAAKAPQGVLEYVGMDAGFSLVGMASGFDCRFVMAENLLTSPINLDFHIV